MELTVNDIINKIENGEISWNNVYDIKIIDKENVDKLKDFSGVKKTLQQALKISINSFESQ